jgi:tetratricopeptide (TPR) repeat protein
MMKMKKLFTIALLWLGVAMCATAQIQQGYVKTKGRLGANGQVIAGKRLSGVTVQIKGRSAVMSQANGSFSFPIPANKFLILSVKKQGYVLADPETTTRQYSYSFNPLVLVMETQEQQTEDKLANERKIRRNLQRQLQAKEEEIEALKEQNKITREEYQQRLQRLYADLESNEKLISEMAERYSRLDYDQMDEFNLRISDCILNGRLTEADSLLRSKGDINDRIAHLNQHQNANQQIQETLDKSKAMAQKDLEDIAQDCYHYYEAFMMNHQNDSAAHYLELRANLDTTNLIWQNEAGSFIHEYLANYSLAMEYFQLGLRQALIQCGEHSNRTATFYKNLSLVHSALGDYNEALVYSQKALDILEHMPEPDSSSIASCLNNIGKVYIDLKENAKALEYFQKSRSIIERIYGTDHPDVAMVYNNIGATLMNQGDNAQALEYYQKSLSIYERVYDTDNPFVAMSYNNIGAALSSQGDNAQALEYYQKALPIYEHVYGPIHPDVAMSNLNIGTVFARQGDYTQAMEYYQKALPIYERIYGTDHPLVANAIKYIGVIHLTLGDSAQALELMNKALSIYERVYGPDHPDTEVIQEIIDYIED